MQIEDLARLREEEERLAKQVARLEWLREEIDRVESEIQRARQEYDVAQKARLLLMEAGKETRRKIKEVLEAVVTRALQAVFDPTYRFEVEIQDEGSQPQVHFYVVCGDPPVREEPTDAMGGGVVDVVSLALRIAFLELCEPGIGGPLILDEPGRHLDKSRSPRLGAILHDLAHEFGRQIILVTHDEALAHSADRVWRVEYREHSEVMPA